MSGKRDGIDIPFSCKCGQVGGVVRDARPAVGDHIVCYCSDCREFAQRFDAGERLLNEAGGTPLYQSRCAQVNLERGQDRLACLHLTDKPTLRWYAGCCRTPMFNTYKNGRVPYVTTLLGNCEASAREQAIGEPVGHLFTEEASGDPGDVPKMPMSRLMRRFLVRMLKDMFSGDRRRSAFFDSETLQPVALPRRAGSDGG